MRRALFLFPLLILACTENLERRPEALNRGRQILGELNLKPLKKEIRHKKYPLRQKVFHGPIHALAQSPSEELLLVKDSDPHLKLVSLRDLKVAARLPSPGVPSCAWASPEIKERHSPSTEPTTAIDTTFSFTTSGAREPQPASTCKAPRCARSTSWDRPASSCS